MKINKRNVSNSVIQAIHCLHANKKTYAEISAAIGFSTWVVGEVIRNNVLNEEEWKNRYTSTDSEIKTDEPEQIVFQMSSDDSEESDNPIVDALNDINKTLCAILNRLDDSLYVRNTND